MPVSTIMCLHGLSFEKKQHIKHIAKYKAYLIDRKTIMIDNTQKRSTKILIYKKELVEGIKPNMKKNDLLLSQKLKVT